MSSDHNLLRHTLATVAYRGRKAISGASEDFAKYPPGSQRTAGKILAHLGELFDWALSLAQGQEEWRNAPVVSWEHGTTRFFDSLAALDAYLASGKPLACTPEHLFQGPIADALTHIGQIAMLRRMAGAPIKGENYSKAEISVGRVGSEQAAARAEF